MFEGPDYPKPLSEDLFDHWLEEGREQKINFEYLLVLWDAFDEKYVPFYVENRSKFNEYEIYGESVNTETIVAIYNLHSEARVSLSV